MRTAYYMYPSANTKYVNINGIATQNHWFMNISIRTKMTKEIRKYSQYLPREVLVVVAMVD